MSYNVLAIGAHPDDIEFGCFGTLKKHKDQGDNVTLLVMTQSDVKDAHTGKVTRDSNISKNEANNAANLLGAKLILGPFQDTKVPFDSESVGFIESIILSFPFKVSAYPLKSGRGPTILIVPIKTLNNCGNSSRLLRRKNRPTLVTRSSTRVTWSTCPSVLW